MSLDDIEWLECQTCGEAIRRLTEDEKRRIRYRPESFIVDCSSCLKQI